MSAPPGGEERRDALRGALEEVRERIARACAAAGRDPAAVTLIAVTKMFPASDVALLAELGVGDVGENRDQEARAKHAAVAPLHPRLRWHHVGQLQRNKARSVTRYVDVVHSVDRADLAVALDAAARRFRHRPLDVLVQVDLERDAPGGAAPPFDAPAGDGGAPGPDGDASVPEPGAPGPDAGAPRTGAGPVGAARGGVRPGEVPALAAEIAALDALRLCGVMAVAPRDGSPDEAFALLGEVAAALRADHSGADSVSAGMSGDLESAIRHGATHVRVGTALLGNRWTPRVR